MGLAIEVGMLASRIENDEGADSFRRSLDGVNKVLVKNELPPHVEPEVLTLSKNRARMRAYPYSYLHHLRRFAAHAVAKPSLGIALDGGTLSDEEADRINSVVRATGLFWIELGVWLSLFEAARLSIQHRTAICFV